VWRRSKLEYPDLSNMMYLSRLIMNLYIQFYFFFFFFGIHANFSMLKDPAWYDRHMMVDWRRRKIKMCASEC